MSVRSFGFESIIHKGYFLLDQSPLDSVSIPVSQLDEISGSRGRHVTFMAFSGRNGNVDESETNMHETKNDSISPSRF